jgi:flagellar biosynthesis/type III secretory pathway chaperone
MHLPKKIFYSPIPCVGTPFASYQLSPANQMEGGMTNSGQADFQDWHMLHDALRDNLQKEIHLTRELLSNMHQEEVSLMLHDTGGLQFVMQQRSYLLEKLSHLRLCRIEVTEKIEKMASMTHTPPSLDEILPPNEEISTEILSLSDQLMALNERMNRQQGQNQRLMQYPDYLRYPQPAVETRSKKKASIATYQIKR